MSQWQYTRVALQDGERKLWAEHMPTSQDESPMEYLKKVSGALQGFTINVGPKGQPFRVRGSLAVLAAGVKQAFRSECLRIHKLDVTDELLMKIRVHALQNEAAADLVAVMAAGDLEAEKTWLIEYGEENGLFNRKQKSPAEQYALSHDQIRNTPEDVGFEHRNGEYQYTKSE